MDLDLKPLKLGPCHFQRSQTPHAPVYSAIPVDCTSVKQPITEVLVQVYGQLVACLEAKQRAEGSL